ncbi:MAG: photosystem I reaction center subunit II [Nostoc sp. ChiQUE01a]|nr:photosystem I reaction center subunit II [Nostoc sp. ChiQUE01a]
MIDPSGIRPSKEDNLIVKEVEPGLYTIENAYEGVYEYFENRPINFEETVAPPELNLDEDLHPPNIVPLKEAKGANSILQFLKNIMDRFLPKNTNEAQIETQEKYFISWISPSRKIAELPTGGTYIMQAGENQLDFGSKLECIAFGTQQLREKFKITGYEIYQVLSNGETKLVFPESSTFQFKNNQSSSSQVSRERD